MLDLRKRFERFFAHALRRRIGRDQFRESRLEIDQLPVQPVIFAVANDWCSFVIIELIVLTNFRSQLCDLFLGFLSLHRWKARYERENGRPWSVGALRRPDSAARRPYQAFNFCETSYA